MSSLPALAKSFRSFADLRAVYVENVDYRITCTPRAGASVGIVAPHGGNIEAHTSDIAAAIADDDFSLYLFEGIRRTDNYATLHLTSQYFDEPRCLQMLSTCTHVVTIHGCKVLGEVVLVGGLDKALAKQLGDAISTEGIECHLGGHEFPATHPTNICNRGARNVGVQLELSIALRMSSEKRHQLVNAVRNVLLPRQASQL